LHPINIGNIINALDIFIWNVELHGRGVDGGGYMCIVESWDCFDEVVSGKNVIFFFSYGKWEEDVFENKIHKRIFYVLSIIDLPKL